MTENGQHLEASELEFLLAGEPVKREGSTAEDTIKNAGMVTIHGNLANISLVDVFQTLSMSQMAGTLRIKTSTTTKLVYFDGQGVQITGDTDSRNKLIGRKLVAAGLIDNETLERTLLKQQKEGGRFGPLLVEQGLVEQDEIEQTLRVFDEEEVLGLFTLTRGTFEFYKDESPQDGLDRQHSSDISNVLLEAARRSDEWELILGEVGDLDEIVLPAGKTKIEGVTPRDLVILGAADGSKSVRDIAESTLIPLFECAKSIAAFLRQGVLRKIELPELTTLVHSLVKRNKVKEAVRAMSLVKGDRTPQTPEAARLAAAAFRVVHDSRAAAAVLVSVATMEIGKDRGQAMNMLAEAIELDQGNDHARRVRRDHLDPKQESDEILGLTRQLCDIHYEQDRIEEAQVELRKLTEMDPDSTHTLSRVVRVNQKAGNTKVARKALESLAENFRDRGNRKQLIQVLEQISRLEPENRDIRREIEELRLDKQGKRRRKIIWGGTTAAVLVVLGSAGLVGNNHLQWRSRVHRLDRLIEEGREKEALETGRGIITDRPDSAAAAKARLFIAELTQRKGEKLLGRLTEQENGILGGLTRAKDLQDREDNAPALAIYRELLQRIARLDALYDSASPEMKKHLERKHRYVRPRLARVIQEVRVPAIGKELKERAGKLAGIVADAQKDAITFAGWRDALTALREYTGRESLSRLTALRKYLQGWKDREDKWPFKTGRKVLADPLDRLIRLQETARVTLEKLEERAENARINDRMGPLWEKGVRAEKKWDYETAYRCFAEIARTVREENSRETAIIKAGQLRVILDRLAEQRRLSDQGDYPGARRLLAELSRLDPSAPFPRMVTMPLRIETMPPGARVHFDGKEVGRTPLLFRFTPSGRHTLRLEAPGFETHREVIQGAGPGRVQLVFSRKVAWETEVKGIIDTPPVIAEDRIYISDRTGRVTCLDLTRGKEIWSFHSGDLSGKLSAPLLRKGGVFVNSIDRRLRRLDPVRGVEAWRRDLPQVPLGPPLAWKDHLLVVMEEGRLDAFDPDRGDPLWSVELSGRITSPPAIAADRVYLLLRPGTLVARDPDRGGPLWSADLPDLATAPPLADDQGVVVACLDGSVLAFDHQGNRLWRQQVDAPVSLPPTWTGKNLVILPDARRALFLDRKEGRPLRTMPLPQAAGAAASVAGGRLFIGLESGQMLALDTGTLDLLWCFQGREKGGITAPARGKGNLLILPAPGRKVVAFELE